MDNEIHRTGHYPVEVVVGFVDTHSLDSVIHLLKSYDLDGSVS